VSLIELRQEIDQIDRQLLQLFIKRMDLAVLVANIKKEQNLPVRNQKREDEILEKIQTNAGAYAPEANKLFETIMELSRDKQNEWIETNARSI